MVLVDATAIRVPLIEYGAGQDRVSIFFSPEMISDAQGCQIESASPSSS
jgi:hypothetical protein